MITRHRSAEWCNGQGYTRACRRIRGALDCHAISSGRRLRSAGKTIMATSAPTKV